MTTTTDVSRPDVEELFDQVEAFRVGSLASQAGKWEVTRSPDQIALREAARMGLTALEVPTELGGLGLGFREKVRVVEILARTSFSFAFSLVNTQNVAARIAAGGTDRHRNQVLPRLLRGYRFGSTALTEPGAGSDFASIQTTATRTDGGWVLNGEKAWITNASIADVVICYAQTEPGSGAGGIAAFLLDGTRAGFSRNEPYALHAGHVIGTGSFVLDGYEAADDDLLTEPGDAFAAALHGVNGARIYVAAMCCSMVRSALATAVAYGAERQAFGRPLLDHQGLAWSLAEVANRLEAAELLTGRAVDLYVDLGDDEAAVGDIVLAAAHAKRFAATMVEPALATCLQSMGAAGLTNEYPLYRLLAEARICSLVDGSTEMQNNRIARFLSSAYGPDTLEATSTAFRRRPHPTTGDTPTDADTPTEADTPTTGDTPADTAPADTAPADTAPAAEPNVPEPEPQPAAPPLPPESMRRHDAT